MSADPRQPSWGEVLDTVLTARLRSVHTAMVGEMVSYSQASQTATVQLGVQLEATGGEWEAVPPLEDVPVLWPGAWTAGDRCLCVFCEESFATWWDTGAVEQPEVLRRHGLHAVCIPIVARAGQDVQLVALANLVDEKLALLATAIGTAVGQEGTGGGMNGMAALQTALATVAAGQPWPGGSVAAEKVMAR